MLRKCKHKVGTKIVTEVAGGTLHQYHVAGDVCIKCGKLVCE